MKNNSTEKLTKNFRSIWTFYFLYFVFRVLSSYHQELEIFPDSLRYLPNQSKSDYIKPDILTNFIYSLIPSHKYIVLLQIIISSLCWIAFAVVVSLFFKGVQLIFIRMFILFYSFSSPALSWDYVALTESFSLSFFILWLAITFWTLKNESLIQRQILIYSITSAICLFARPRFITVLLPATLFVLYKYFKSNASRSNFGSIIFLLAIYSFTVSRLIPIMLSDKMRYWYGLNNFANKMGFQRWVISETGGCDYLSQNNVWEMIDNVNLRETLPAKCSNIYEFILSNGSGFNWFLNQPLTVIHAFVKDFGRLEPISITSQTSSISRLVDSYIFPNASYFQSIWIVLLVGFIVSIFPKQELSYLKNALLFTIFILGNFFQEWLSDGMEETRHVLIPSLIFPVLLFFICINVVHGFRRLLKRSGFTSTTPIPRKKNLSP